MDHHATSGRVFHFRHAVAQPVVKDVFPLLADGVHMDFPCSRLHDIPPHDQHYSATYFLLLSETLLINSLRTISISQFALWISSFTIFR